MVPYPVALWRVFDQRDEKLEVLLEYQTDFVLAWREPWARLLVCLIGCFLRIVENSLQN